MAECGELQSMEDASPKFIFPQKIHKVGNKIRVKLINIPPDCTAELQITSCPEGIDIQVTEENGYEKNIELTPKIYGTFKLKSDSLTEYYSGSNIVSIVPMMKLEKRMNCSPPLQLPRNILVFGGALIIADGISRQIIKMDLNNTGKQEIFDNPSGQEKPFSPIGLAIKEDCMSGNDEEVYVTDLENACVHVYHGPAKYLESFGKKILQRPTGICIDKDGYIFIADYILNKILQFDGDYELVEDDGDYDLNGPELMTILHKQNGMAVLLAADRKNHRIAIFYIQRKECEERGKDMRFVHSIDLSINGIPVLPFSVVCEEPSGHIFVAGQTQNNNQKVGVIVFIDGNHNRYSDIPEKNHPFFEGLRNPGGMCLIPSTHFEEKAHLLVTDMRGKNAKSCINSFIL